MDLNILVFPCGSEIALELHRSLKFSRHITLFGANSVDDHGKFVFENYIGGLPFFSADNFIDNINKIIDEYKIDAIYPAMDAVIAKLSEVSDQINCKIIGSSNETNQICLSKKITYDLFIDEDFCPKQFNFDELDNTQFPLFMKPTIGYGSRGAYKVNSIEEVGNQLVKYPNSLILEYLPGIELTVDCFTDKYGRLRFFGPRVRTRVVNGISVNTQIYKDNYEEISSIVNCINNKIKFRGAWFVQLKFNKNNKLSLLEIAARFGGSSSLYRNLGINFALLSVFDAFDYDIDLFTNSYEIELDRALDNKYKLSIYYDYVYCDFDDCLIIKNKVNTQLLAFLYQCLNEGKILILITKHDKDINQTLQKYRLIGLFDQIIHLKMADSKYRFISHKNSIFIDDSYKERLEVYNELAIPCFAPDNIEILIK